MPTEYPHAMRVCSTPGCPTIYPRTQGKLCPTHTKEQLTRTRRRTDQHRGTARQRGYNTKGHATFRHAVLTRDPICVICNQRRSTIADHHPKSRRDLIYLGIDPNDPTHGRGLCKQCHDRSTAENQPGGWNKK